MNKEQIKERLVELNYDLSIAMLKDNYHLVDILRNEINILINQYIGLNQKQTTK